MTPAPNAKLALLVNAHQGMKQAAAEAATAIGNERNRERQKARALLADVVALRREQFRLTDIAARFGPGFGLATMCDVEDGFNQEPETMLTYAARVMEYAKFTGLSDTGGDGGGAPGAPPEEIDPETLLPFTLQPDPRGPMFPPILLPNPKYKPPIDPETIPPFTLQPDPRGPAFPPIMLPNPKFKPRPTP